MPRGKFGKIDMDILEFYQGKNVLVTGHTGFKGTWLCKILCLAGANVTGYALEPNTKPNLFSNSDLTGSMHSVIGDIRDFEFLQSVFDKTKPEIVFHLAAQPIVLESYNHPRYTYETNIMGTVNILECIRRSSTVKSFLNVTTDKVYENKDTQKPFIESDKLDGFDPYSNSKSCSELVTHAYTNSFLNTTSIAVSTARAGNVIGGGDFADNRIIPDCIRASIKKEPIIIRNPYSIRPFQHVLDPLFVYLMIAMEQYRDITLAGCYNVGPNAEDCITTGALADLFCKYWQDGASWKNICKDTPHEAAFLRLDCSKLKETFHWEPVWNVEKAVQKTVEFTKEFYKSKHCAEIMQKQIYEFVGDRSV